MANTTSMNIRVDTELKRRAEAIFNELGLSLSTAMIVFLKNAVRNGGLPFEMRLPIKPRGLAEMSKEELDAELEVGLQDIESGRYRSAEEFFAELEQRHIERYGA
ncbi:MAG: type II toxin-antitoxin system RelB/DinJ family antitoxin [Firmicutes bacterium]|nr:type II toxin-antitoxin system RelB/DinJ family antitoxin [Bacillota bacterium]